MSLFSKKSTNAESSAPIVIEDTQQPNSVGGNQAKQFSLKDVTFSNVRNFIEGYGNKIINDTLKILPQHKQEQAVYRSMLCKECLDNARCVVCGCGTPAMFYSPKKTDSKKRWGEMMEEPQWIEFKKNNNLEFPENLSNYFNTPTN